MQENQIQVLGFEHLRDLYEADIDFQEAYRACKNPVEVNREPWMDYTLQYGLLFRNICWRHYLMPKEFVLYCDNHALQYIMQQPKLNLKHVKWVEFLQIFTFLLRHISG